MSSVLLLAVVVSLGNAQKAPKDAPPPPPPKPAKPPPKTANPKAGVAKAGVPKGANRIVNPANVITRLYSMSSDQRERLIEQMQPQQQERVRKNLAWFDSLPKEQQQMQLRRIQRYEQLTPEKKVEVSELVKQANQLPPARRVVVGRALARLQQVSDQERENILHRPAFQAQFSPEELKIINGLADAWMPQ